MVDVGASSGSVTKAGKVPKRDAGYWGTSKMKQRDLVSFHTAYHFPPEARSCFVYDRETPYSQGGTGEICFFKTPLKLGVGFPFRLSIHQILRALRLSPMQIVPNGWRVLLGCTVLWPMHLGQEFQLTLREFLWFYAPTSSSHGDKFWYFYPRLQRASLVAHSPDNNKGWHELFSLCLVLGGSIFLGKPIKPTLLCVWNLALFPNPLREKFCNTPTFRFLSMLNFAFDTLSFALP
ncbi:hypothetical protein CJ030_MR7G000024 [Morella rubra]|uniref:Uncharacterized protein n=1 Tax=Morella rubra TaxID=262757 RepID=A0A6A1V5J9_9ROSI|nr:hypothetical protein CJ030_MR7G000024 [Morella rubra]